MASFLLDGLLIGLLAVTIVYAAILDRRLRTFRHAREEMQALLTNFTGATVQAQSGIAALRDASQTASAELKDQLERGKALRDDLAFLIDRGTSLADRLEGGISVARATAKTTDVRGRPAIKLAEAVSRQVNETRADRPARDMRSNAARAAEPRVSDLRAERVGELRGAEKTDPARDFLRALRVAR